MKISGAAWSSVAPHFPPRHPEESREDLAHRRRQMLFHALDTQTLIAFVGAGCTRDLYGSWADLVNAVAQKAGQRFGNTNYHVELEYDLAECTNRKVSLDDFDLDSKSPSRRGKSLSFTQEKDFGDRLALFALAEIEENENTIFHCHGRYDRAESIVAT